MEHDPEKDTERRPSAAAVDAGLSGDEDAAVLGKSRRRVVHRLACHELTPAQQSLDTNKSFDGTSP